MNRTSALLLAGVLLGCGSSDTGGAAQSNGLCTPGASVACVGPGGCAGAQVCADDGGKLGVCDCGSPDAGGGDAADAGPDVSTDTTTDQGGSEAAGDTGADSPLDGSLDGFADGGVEADAAGDAPDAADGAPKDGTYCSADDGGTDGRWHAGACCTGCWDGTTCRLANQSDLACGSQGHDCIDCGYHYSCAVPNCVGFSANSGGFCDHSQPTGATTCNYVPFGSGADAGSTPGVCNFTDCVECGNDGEPCCPGHVCSSGVQCYVVTADTDAGTVETSATCASACGGFGEFCCNGSDCSGSGTACHPASKQCVTCGGIAQPCCQGGSCSAGSCNTYGYCY